jgi:hypothetical protein
LTARHCDSIVVIDARLRRMICRSSGILPSSMRDVAASVATTPVAR